MKSGSGGGPYLAEVYLDLITVGVKGTVSDVCLTGSVQWDWADATVCICVVQRALSCPDHVAGYISRPSVACTPATSARDCDHHPLCSSLVDIMFLLVIHQGNKPEILPDSHHSVWETARPQGSCAQWGAQARWSVPRGPLCCSTCGWEAFHAPRAALPLVRYQECYPLHARVPSEHPQHRARDHDAHMVHLQPGHSSHIHSGSEWGLFISKHLRSDRGWWVGVLKWTAMTFHVHWSPLPWPWCRPVIIT